SETSPCRPAWSYRAPAGAETGRCRAREARTGTPQGLLPSTNAALHEIQGPPGPPGFVFRVRGQLGAARGARSRPARRSLSLPVRWRFLLLSRYASRARLVNLRQTFVRRCHRGNRAAQCAVMTQQNGNPVVARSARRRRCSAAPTAVWPVLNYGAPKCLAASFSSSPASSFGVPRCTAWRYDPAERQPCRDLRHRG